jgi:hypothetical protein
MTIIDQRIIDTFNQRAPFDWDEGTLLIFAQVGSHSHNTRLPEEDTEKASDSDYIGIVVPPIEYLLGRQNWDNTDFKVDELDCKFYSFRQFMNLMAKGNPNVIDLLFLDERNILAEHPDWAILSINRDAFLNKGTTFSAFTGFAHGKITAMERYTEDIDKKYKDAIKLVDLAGWNLDRIIKKGTINQPSKEHIKKLIDYLGNPYNRGYEAQVEYVLNVLSDTVRVIQHIHAKYFQGYMGEKRKALVVKYGYDIRAAAHAIRLMRMLVEYLHTSEFQVWRTDDADELRDIKRGKWSLDEVKTELQMLADRAKQLRETSTLPMEPDFDRIEKMQIKIYKNVYNL